MGVTQLTNIPIPDEDEDPFFDSFINMTTDLDNKFYGLLQSVGNILIPSPGLAWDGVNGIFTWTGDFIMPILSTNFQLAVRFGPDLATRSLTLNDGDKVVIVTPVSSAENLVGNFLVVPGKVAYQAGLFVFGMRVGSHFYANIPQTF